MRASVTAARLKYRMRAICYFGAAPLEDPHERLAARETLASARLSAGNELSFPDPRPRDARGATVRSSSDPSVIGWRLSAGTQHAAPSDCSDGAAC
jgi:hypothetical protein